MIKEIKIITIIIIIIKLEKLEKCQLLKDEIAKVWRMRKVIVVPVVNGALGAVSVNFKDYVKGIGVNVR